MATVPYGYYKQTVNGIEYVEARESSSTPYGYTPITFEEFLPKAKQQFVEGSYGKGVSYYDYLAQSKDSGALVPGSASGYVTDASGTLTTQKAIDEQVANKAGVASGALVPVKVGSGTGYVPADSPAAAGIQGGQTQPQPTPAPPPTASPIETQTYTVVAGDTVSQIAAQYGVPISSVSGFRSGNPNLIYPGEKLTITPQGASGVVTLRKPPTQAPNAASGTTAPPGTQTFSDSVNALMKQWGITPPDPTKSPITSFTDMYSKIYSDLGLSTVKQQITDVTKQYNDLQNKQIDEIAGINDNPWLAEGIRQRKIQNIQDKYIQKLNALNGQISVYEKLYNDGRQDAQFAAKSILDETHQNQSFNQDALFKAIDITEKALQSQKPTSDLQEYEYAQSQGYKGTFIDYQKQLANIKSSGTQSSIDNAAVQGIAEQLTSAAGSDGFTDPNLYARLRQISTVSPTEFDNRFGYLVNPLSRAKLGITASGASGRGTQYLTSQWFKQIYPIDQLYSQANAAGYGSGLLGSKEDAVDKYLGELQKSIQAYRDAGFTDDDILKMMK